MKQRKRMTVRALLLTNAIVIFIIFLAAMAISSLMDNDDIDIRSIEESVFDNYSIQSDFGHISNYMSDSYSDTLLFAKLFQEFGETEESLELMDMLLANIKRANDYCDKGIAELAESLNSNDEKMAYSQVSESFQKYLQTQKELLDNITTNHVDDSLESESRLIYDYKNVSGSMNQLYSSFLSNLGMMSHKLNIIDKKLRSNTSITQRYVHTGFYALLMFEILMLYLTYDANKRETRQSKLWPSDV